MHGQPLSANILKLLGNRNQQVLPVFIVQLQHGNRIDNGGVLEHGQKIQSALERERKEEI